MSVDPIPEGHHAVTPYLVIQGAPRLIDFLKQAFDAQEIHRMVMPDGRVMHAQVKVGDSMVMMGEAHGPSQPAPAMLYLYVRDCDTTYRRALEAGAVSISPLKDEFYGDRVGAVKDPSGNQWWIATHKEDVPADDLPRRAQAAMKQRQADQAAPPT